MTTVSFHCGRTTGALRLSFKAISCGMKDSTSLGECSPSSNSQSKPARPRISVVIGLASEHQQPISFFPAIRSRRNWLGKAEYGSVDMAVFSIWCAGAQGFVSVGLFVLRAGNDERAALINGGGVAVFGPLRGIGKQMREAR